MKLDILVKNMSSTQWKEEDVVPEELENVVPEEEVGVVEGIVISTVSRSSCTLRKTREENEKRTREEWEWIKKKIMIEKVVKGEKEKVPTDSYGVIDFEGAPRRETAKVGALFSVCTSV